MSRLGWRIRHSGHPRLPVRPSELKESVRQNGTSTRGLEPLRPGSSGFVLLRALLLWGCRIRPFGASRPVTLTSELGRADGTPLSFAAPDLARKQKDGYGIRIIASSNSATEIANRFQNRPSCRPRGMPEALPKKRLSPIVHGRVRNPARRASAMPGSADCEVQWPVGTDRPKRHIARSTTCPRLPGGRNRRYRQSGWQSPPPQRASRCRISFHEDVSRAR